MKTRVAHLVSKRKIDSQGLTIGGDEYLEGLVLA